MKRWAIVVLVSLSIAAAAVSVRTVQLTGDLNDAQSEIDALRDELAAAESDGEHKGDLLAADERQLKALNRELREKRQALRDRQPCPNYPRLILSRPSGPPGTRVTFTGYCFTSDYRGYDLSKDEGYGLFITNPAQDLSDPDYVSNGGPECELMAGTEPHQLIVRRNGTAHGYLTIPFSGGCFQEDRTEAISPGQYHIGLGCHACAPLAVFRVTS